MLQPSLSQILIASGYNTNLGQHVYFGDPAEAAEYQVEAIYFKPVKRRLEPENNRWKSTQTWEITAICDKDKYLLAEADIWRALGANRTLSGMIDNLLPGEVSYSFDGSSVLVGLTCSILTKSPIFQVS